MHWVRSAFAIGATLVAACGMYASGGPLSPMTLDGALTDAQRLAARHEGGQVMRVEGASMLPFFGDNSVLVTKPVSPERLRPGMVVVYRNRFGEIVAHRIEAHSEGGWIVRGYSNPADDSTLVCAENLLGVVYATFYSNGRVSDGGDLAAVWAQTPVALAAPAR
ncbi:MAG TPA: S24/S26 family peptidase [Candidatus Synoicihabitans sp.]|nr:S24/S26 family peptidase [Candidatus Synoicihabitans sp.]